MRKEEYRARIRSAVEKLSSLPELVASDFIITNHKAQRHQERIARAKERLSKLPAFSGFDAK